MVVGRRHVGQEYMGSPFPGVFQSLLPAFARIQLQGTQGGLLQVVVEAACNIVSHDINRTRDWIGRHRGAAGHRFQHDDPEGIGFAWEHEYIRGGEIVREVLSELVAGEPDVAVLAA